MRKAFYGFFFFVLTCTTLSAQNKIDKINLTYGEELPDDRQKIVKIIGENANKIYALGLADKEDYFIKIFDSKTMKLLSSKPIVIPSMNNKEVDFEDIFLLNGNLYAIGSVYNKSDKTFNLIGASISENGVLSTNTTSLFNSVVAKNQIADSFILNNTTTKAILCSSCIPLFLTVKTRLNMKSNCSMKASKPFFLLKTKFSLTIIKKTLNL